MLQPGVNASGCAGPLFLPALAFLHEVRKGTYPRMRQLLFILASLWLGLLLAFAGALRRPLVRLVRGLLAGLAAVFGVAGAAIGVAGLTSEAWWAVVVGGAMLLAALRLGWALRRPRRGRQALDEIQHVPLTRSVPDPHWNSFEADLDWVGRQQARRARTAIDGLVAERSSPSLTHEHRSLLLSCEKRVPELLETVEERCRNASRQERARYIDATLNTLVQIGGEAERARREVREADDRRLQVLHRYFEGVAGSSDERPPQP